MNSRWIDIQTAQGETFSGYLTLPPTGSGPGIVLVQEIWGVNEHIRAVAEQYALDGYVVLAPDVFWRLSPRVDLAYDDAGTQQAFGYYQRVDTALAAADVAAAVATLRQLPQVTGKVATLGFCLGGQLAYRAAALSQADAAVCYYGGGIHDQLAAMPSVNGVMQHVLPRFVIANSVRDVYGNPDQVSPALVDRYYDLAVREGNPDIQAFDCSVFNGEYVTGDIDDNYLDALQASRNDSAKNQKEKGSTIVDLANG